MSFENIKLITKYFLGQLTVKDGSLCKFSKTFFDIHDYPISKGGTGIPDHYIQYECPYCKTKFKI